MKSLLREPLVHFLGIGLLMFLLYGLVSENDGPESMHIKIDKSDINLMIARWQKQWQRVPTTEELQGLIEAQVREEVLYREAVAMGLDQNDTIVRRRVAQKMDFVLADASSASQPADDELQKFMEENIERFQDPARISFTHVYFSFDKRGNKTETDANAVLARIQNQKLSTSQAVKLGDPFMLYYEYEANSRAQVSRNFGDEFAETLFKQKGSGWTGPVRSGYGLHLVYISQFRQAIPPRLEEVKQRVQAEYLSEKGREAKERAYQRLRDRYTVEVEEIPAASS